MSTVNLETDVLVVGSGPAGLTTAVGLASHGVDHIVITKYQWTANTPRAHITNQASMEIFRDFGVEKDVLEKATPHELMGDTVFCTSLTGEEIGRIRTWGVHPQREADYTMASPTQNCDIPQDLLEPILLNRAAKLGSKVRFNTEFISFVQDENGVTTTVQDRVSGTQYTIRSKYLVGADGGRSKVAELAGLAMEGQMDIAGSMNIVFKADLSQYVAHRPSVLYWVLQPGSTIGGIGLGLVRMVRTWDEWLIVWGYDINQPAPEVTDEMAISLVRNLVGAPELEVEITSTSVWGNNKMYATEMNNGRVYCMGDATHRHPPSNGLGSNTSVQDAFNLAWKLAYVLQGKAGQGLLDSYNQERSPIAKQIVLRANKSIEEFGGILQALGILDTNDPKVMQTRIDARRDNTPEGAKRRAELKTALELKDYEFNAHGVELGQRYSSKAIIKDGTPEPALTRDPELYYHPTTWPGARLPHAWLGRDGFKVSTKDLAGHGKFALLTGISGEKWAAAAREVAAELGIEISAHVIGPGREYTDIYEDWTRLREVGEDGCILVRPDQFVAWRSTSLAANPKNDLLAALKSLLSR
jgi:2,4-dichlorophenol 6-monooxygenase